MTEMANIVIPEPGVPYEDAINKMYLTTISIFTGTWTDKVTDLVCASKDLLKLKDLPTNTRVLDSPLRTVGVTDVFRSEGWDVMSVTFPSAVTQSLKVIEQILANQEAEAVGQTLSDGVIATVDKNFGYNVMFRYAGRPALGIANCYLLGFEMGGGENNSSPDSTLRIQPSGRTKPVNLLETPPQSPTAEYTKLREPFAPAVTAWTTANSGTT